MLLLPVEDQGSWRRPPVLILALLLINLVVHLHTESQWRDPAFRLDHFLNETQLNLLLQKEWPLFLEWIEEDRPRLWLEVHETAADERRDVLERHAWQRAHFSRHVRRHWEQQSPSAEWRQARERLEQWRSQQPVIAYGLIPAEADAVSLLTHMFMHGGWGHLFGNMLFLLLFGVPMERHWGLRRLAPMYLLCGLGSAAVSIAMDPDSDIPTVGASGAISGLMGIYAASYGLRRIEFFYTLGFVFGSFRAPAFAVFPLWLLMEIVQSLTLNTNVAYMAHVGGLLSGAAIALAGRIWWPPPEKADDNTVEAYPINAQQAQQADAVPAGIERLARELNFDQALENTRRRLEANPQWPALWDFALELAPRADYEQQRGLLQLAVRQYHQGRLDAASLARYWNQARTWSAPGRQLSPAALLILAEVLARQGATEDSHALVNDLTQSGFAHERLERLRQQLEGVRSAD